MYKNPPTVFYYPNTIKTVHTKKMTYIKLNNKDNSSSRYKNIYMYYCEYFPSACSSLKFQSESRSYLVESLKEAQRKSETLAHISFGSARLCSVCDKILR